MQKRPEQTDATKAALKEAFWELYSEQPFRKISVAQVTTLAGYTRGTFYLHFQDMFDLLEGIENEMLERSRACVGECMTRLEQGEDPERCMRDMLAFYEENKRYLVVLLGPKGDSAFAERLKADLKPLWAKYVLHREEGEAEDDFLLEFSVSGVLFMVRKWMEHPQGVSPEKFLHLVYHQALGR